MPPVTRRYLAALVVIVVAAGAVHALRALSITAPAYQPNFQALPRQIAGHDGEELEVNESIFGFLGADAMIERLYTGPDGWVSVTLIYGAHWRNVHSPAGCYPAQGWLIITDDPIEVAAPDNSPTPAPVEGRLLRVMKNEQQRLAMFSFCHPGGTTSDWTKQGWKVATGPRGAGGVIIILNTEPIPTRSAAQQRLKQFLAEVYPYAVSFWYQESDAAAG